MKEALRSDQPLLVFVHGVGANAAHWHWVMIKLSRAGFPVLALDIPAHGHSGNYEGQLSPESMYNSFAEFLLKVVDDEKFILIGNSLGGALSLQFAHQYSERLAGLILISPAVGFETKEEWDNFRPSLRLNNIRDALQFVRKIYHRPPWYLPLVARIALGTMNRPGVQQLLDATTLQVLKSLTKRPEIDAHIRVVWGQSDNLLPSKNLNLFRQWRDIDLMTPKSIGHCPQLDNPKWIANNCIREYIRKYV